MMTSRTIGYHEKKEKQSTAPIRNAQAAPLRRARGSSACRRLPLVAGGAIARRATLVTTFAIRFSCQFRWRVGRAPGGGGAAGGVASGARPAPGWWWEINNESPERRALFVLPFAPKVVD